MYLPCNKLCTAPRITIASRLSIRPRMPVSFFSPQFNMRENKGRVWPESIADIADIADIPWTTVRQWVQITADALGAYVLVFCTIQWWFYKRLRESVEEQQQKEKKKKKKKEKEDRSNNKKSKQ